MTVISSTPALPGIEDFGRKAASVVGAAAVAVSLFVWNLGFRTLEALTLRVWLGFWQHAVVYHDIVYLHYDTPKISAMHITPDCTAAILFLPLLLVFCIFVAGRRVSTARVLSGLLAGMVVAYAANQARLVGIALGWQLGGASGFQIMHVVVGSMVSIAGVAIALFVQIRLSVRTGRSRTSRC